jgi:hypothetical protein
MVKIYDLTGDLKRDRDIVNETGSLANEGIG